MSEERKHHEYSPSKLQFLEACPGFSGIQSTNAASERGTAIHDAIESGDYETKGFSDDEIRVIEDCRAYVSAAVAEWPGSELIVEAYLPIDAEDTSAGYLDVALIRADKKAAKIKDWKTGLNAVEPTANNLQGMAYLLGLVFKVPTIEECEVEFIMPFQGGEGIVDRHTFYRASFDAMHLRIKTIVARAKAAKAARLAGDFNFAGLNPNTSTCLFCANLASCDAVQRHALAVGKKYNPLQVPDVINPSLIKDPKDAGKALEFFAVMKALAESYRSEVTNKALTEPDFMPEGYQIVTTTRRKIVSNESFAKVLFDMGCTQEEIMTACEFTLGPAEKLVSNKAAKGKKKAAVEELAILLDSAGATAESAPVSMLKKKKVEALEIAADNSST